MHTTEVHRFANIKHTTESVSEGVPLFSGCYFGTTSFVRGKSSEYCWSRSPLHSIQIIYACCEGCSEMSVVFPSKQPEMHSFSVIHYWILNTILILRLLARYPAVYCILNVWDSIPIPSRNQLHPLRKRDNKPTASEGVPPFSGCMLLWYYVFVRGKLSE